ncbi:MAG: TonB-dependent receptor, partial [Bacteroidetes bacterium]|nr:TonB-dependent receptor [Bacteroidota bacterium]
RLVLGFRSFTAKDTGTSRTENLFTMNGGSVFHLSPIDLKADMDLKVASSGLSLIQVKAQVEQYEWHNIFFDGALLLSWLKGMDGQNFVRPYPWLGISSYLLPQHRFYLRYQPMPRFQSLWDLMDACPYLSAQSIIRHQNITNAGVFGIESHWTSDIQSNAQVSVQTIEDYALLKELRQGWWEAIYKEKVTVVSFLGELVAKLAVNDYFSTQMKVQSGTVKHGLKVPYLPVIELREMWEHTFSDVARSNVMVRYIGKRYSVSSTESTSKMSPIFLMDVNGEYDIRSNIKLILEVQNLTNSKFSWWDNYRAEPFVIKLGARFQW